MQHRCRHLCLFIVSKVTNAMRCISRDHVGTKKNSSQSRNLHLQTNIAKGPFIKLLASKLKMQHRCRHPCLFIVSKATNITRYIHRDNVRTKESSSHSGKSIFTINNIAKSLPDTNEWDWPSRVQLILNWSILIYWFSDWSPCYKWIQICLHKYNKIKNVG